VLTGRPRYPVAPKTHARRPPRMVGLPPRAVLLVLVLLCGCFAGVSAEVSPEKIGHHSPPSQADSHVQEPFYGEFVVNLTNARGAPLVLEASLASSCDGVRRRPPEGTAILIGRVVDAFTLADVNVTLLLHCGVREGGEPTFDIRAAGAGRLVVTIDGQERALPSYSITASIFDDFSTGGHFIAGLLRAVDDGGDIYWFDTCADSFEVRGVMMGRVARAIPVKKGVESISPLRAREMEGRGHVAKTPHWTGHDRWTHPFHTTTPQADLFRYPAGRLFAPG